MHIITVNSTLRCCNKTKISDLYLSRLTLRRPGEENVGWLKVSMYQFFAVYVLDSTQYLWNTKHRAVKS